MSKEISGGTTTIARRARLRQGAGSVDCGNAVLIMLESKTCLVIASVVTRRENIFLLGVMPNHSEFA